MDSVAATWAKISSQLCQNGVPAVCLLVAVISDHHANEEDQEQLQQVLQWCVENGFELIEWTAKRPQKGINLIRSVIATIANPHPLMAQGIAESFKE